jgi:hypothetical protein
MSRSSYPVDPEREPDSPRRRIVTEIDPHSDAVARRVESIQNLDRELRAASRSLRPERVSEALDSPRAHYTRDRTYFLRESELETLTEVGTFRVVAASDLARLSYGKDEARMEREIGRLEQHGLLSEKPVYGPKSERARLVALTKRGASLVRKSGSVSDDQAIYYGFRKPREARHDADLYRVYSAQADKIHATGGRTRRVVLDYELKRNLNRDLETLGIKGRSHQALEQIAERHRLSVVNGKIPVPDLRVEYTTAELEAKHLDLELATRNYRPRALAEKAKAGFSLFARSEDASRLRRVLHQQEITAVILSL